MFTLRADFEFMPTSPYVDDDWVWPPRSRLFPLPPIGVGTPMVEGLLSYVIRLAGTHSVSPRRLVRDELMQACPELGKYRRSGPFFKSTAKSANGLHRFSELFVEVVERLCCQEVNNLTLLSLKDLLPFNGPGLLATQPHWCPACYAEMLASHTDIYQPLAWSLGLYRACPKHLIALEDHCPTCGGLQDVIPRMPLIGFCSQCGGWLGKARGEQRHPDAMSLWIANALGEIVAELPTIESFATRTRFVHQVGRAIAGFTCGSRRQFCLQLGLPESSLECLVGGDKRPTLSLWLVIAYGLDVSPLRFIKGDFDAKSFHPPLRSSARALRCRAAKGMLSAERRQAIEHELRGIVEARDGRCSVCELARRWHVTRSCLRFLWPELCQKISANYRTHSHMAAAQVLAEKCRIVREAVDDFVDHGAYPGQRAIAKALAGRGVSLAHPAIHNAYRERVKQRLYFGAS